MSQEQLTFPGLVLQSGAPLQNVWASGCRIAFVFSNFRASAFSKRRIQDCGIPRWLVLPHKEQR